MLNRILLSLLLLPSLALAASSADDQNAQIQAASAPVVIDENATDAATCAAKWARYYNSQECFAPYHNVNHSMKPGADQHCTNVPYPAGCPLQSPQQ